MAFKDLMYEFNIPYSDELSSFYTSVNESLWKALERKEITKQYLKDTRFGPVYDKACELFPSMSIPRPSSVSMNSRYMSLFANYAFYLPGAESMLREVHSFGVPMYIITNGTKFTAESRIALSGVSAFMTDVFISDVIGVNKPDKGFFEYVMNSVGDKNPDNYLVIGDSLTSDILGAQNCGMASCLFTATGSFPVGFENYSITHFASGYPELVSVIKAHLSQS